MKSHKASFSGFRGNAEQVVEGFPVESLRHTGWPLRIGVRERVAHGRRYAHRAPKSAICTRDVADRIELLGFRRLTVKHCCSMAFRRKGVTWSLEGYWAMAMNCVQFGILLTIWLMMGYTVSIIFVAVFFTIGWVARRLPEKQQ